MLEDRRVEKICTAWRRSVLEKDDELESRGPTCAELIMEMRFGVVSFDYVLGFLGDRHRIIPGFRPVLGTKKSGYAA